MKVADNGWSDEANEVVRNLFVYGTLRSRHSAHSLIADHVMSSEPATTTGHIFAFTHGYPGLIDGEHGRVVGELFVLRGLRDAFELLDAYEGDDFRRILKQVEVAGRKAWAWCYVLASEAIAVGQPLIEHGDWLLYARDEI